MKPLHRVRIALCLVAALMLAACAGSAPAPKPSPQAEATVQPHGGFKVGPPYKIDGVWYYPAEDWSYDETGIASWYGEQFHGRYTADGEVFDLNAMTAAHRTLPMPTVVEVTNLENGRAIKLRVNDRGPFARSRIIDVSRRAAQLLGFETNGTAKVRVRILVPESVQAAAAKHQGGGDAAPALAAAPRETVTAEVLPPPAGTRTAAGKPATEPPKRSGGFLIGSASAAEPTAPDRVETPAVKPSQIYIQAGAFTQPDNAQRLESRLQTLGPVSVTGVAVNGVPVYRVRVGPIATVAEADQLLGRILGGGIAAARIVVD